MESCDLVFLGDGSGWSEWSNCGGAFEVLRLQWKVPTTDQLTVLIQEYLGGTWMLDGLVTHFRVERQRYESRSLITSYVSHPGVDALRRPVTLLELGKEIGLANRYALMHRDVQAIDEPIRATESGAGRRAAWLFRHRQDRGPDAGSGPTWAGSRIK